MASVRQLLELYVEAKDLARPALMRSIYRADALLTYSIATDSIRFPERASGVDAITQVLIVDFAQRYRRCKTYYISDRMREDPDDVVHIPWLVVMHEVDGAALRIGKGYYRWTFAGDDLQPAAVAAMHIHIERMDAIDDPAAELLESIQASLTYPWLESRAMGVALQRLIESHARFSFLDSFLMPIELPLSVHRE